MPEAYKKDWPIVLTVRIQLYLLKSFEVLFIQKSFFSDESLLT